MRPKNILSKKNIYIIGTIVMLYTLIGFFLLPVIGKNILTDKLSQSLNRDVFIDKIAVNPFTFTAAIHTLVVKDKNKDVFFSAQKIFGNLSLSSLFTLTPVVSEISLENPFVHIIRNKDTTYNFSDLLKTEKSDELTLEKTDKEIIGVVLKNVNITGGEFVFDDKAMETSHFLKDFSLSFPLLSSKRNHRYETSTIKINFVLNQTKFVLLVASTPFAEDVATQVDIKTSQIDGLHYLSYLPIPETVQLNDFDFDLNLHADFRKKDSDTSLILNGRVNVLNIDVKDTAEQEIFGVPKLTIDILESDVLANQLNISKILMITPKLNVIRDKNGLLNLVKYISQNKEHPEIIENKKEIKTGDQKEDQKEDMAIDRKTVNNTKPLFVFNLADLEIQNAAVSFQDSSNENDFKTNIFPLNIRVENFKAGNSVSGKYSLNFVTEIQETIESNGRFQTNPVQAEGGVTLSNLIINKYEPYYERLIGFDIKTGGLNVSSGFDISGTQEKFDIKINSQDVMIKTLSVFDQHTKEEMLNIPELKIKDAFIDVGNKIIETGNIVAQNGKILIKRLKDGRINLVKSVQIDKQAEESKTTKNATGAGKTKEGNTSPWDVTVNSFDAAGFNVKFHDLTNSDPVKIDLSHISITGSDIKTFGKDQGKIASQINWNKDGRISVRGSLVPSELRAALDIDLGKIDIKSLQPYFTDAIRVLVTDGTIDTKGKLNLLMGGKTSEQIGFVGEASITNFISLDKKSAKDFFKCNSLFLSGLDVSLFPVKLQIKDISLTDFYSRIIVTDSGETNLNSIFKKEPASAQSGESTENQEKAVFEPPQIGIESVTLQGGNVNFSDYMTQPNFTAGMKQIAGSINGLSSNSESRADIHLQGLHGESSPLDIIGTINPLAQKKFADIDVSFKDIELIKFTPYSSKFLGYKIEKGKLLLDLEYNIDDKKLKSENRIRFDNFELGEKTNSESATSLPVGLAISLLKNPDGQINLDLPVTGELDDPEFKIGSIIFKMLANLVIKVVASPFSIIGSLFGGGEELSFVDFEYGDGEIKNKNYEKIDKLVQILHQKPSINLEIEGGFHKLGDAEGIRMKGFKDLIKAVKLKDILAQGSTAATLEDVDIKEEEVPFYIDKAYRQAQFPKPRDEAGKEKEIDIEEKRKLLITNININENDLRLLAMIRSEKIKAYILSTGKVEKERIFLLEPKENDSSNTDGKSRVKFLLR